MEVKKEYIVIAAVLLFVIGFYLYYHPGNETKVAFAVIGDPLDAASFLDANTIIVRAVYPFSDLRGVSNAVVYLTSVFTAKGKTVIIQYIDGNTCYTNEGNVENAVTIDANACYSLPYPVIEIHEGTKRVIVEKNRIEIYAPPQDMLYGASLAARMVYPDADEVYKQVMSMVGRIRKPTPSS